MKIDLANLLRNAATTINPRKDHGGYTYMLGEIADHIDDVRAGRHSVAEFADYYGLAPLTPAPPPA